MIRVALAAVSVGLLINLMSMETPRHHYVLEAVTPDGQVYEAGSGSTCESAWVNPVFPVAVDHVGCVKVR